MYKSKTIPCSLRLNKNALQECAERMESNKNKLLNYILEVGIHKHQCDKYDRSILEWLHGCTGTTAPMEDETTTPTKARLQEQHVLYCRMNNVRLNRLIKLELNNLWITKNKPSSPCHL